MLSVLIVDNDSDFRSTYEGVLLDANAKYDVLSVATEAEAIEALNQKGFNFSFVDIRLYSDDDNDFSGISLAALIRYISPSTKVFLISGQPMEDKIRRVMKYIGDVEYLSKTSLHERIIEILGKYEDAIHTETFPFSVPQKTNWAKEKIESTQIFLSFIPRQRLFVRSRGRHAHSARTLGDCKINVERYKRKTKIALKNPDDRRFHIKELGKELWGEIFGDFREVWGTFAKAQAKSKLLKLQFEISREDFGLPLEFIRMDVPQKYLIEKHPVTRFIYDVDTRQTPINPEFFARTLELKVLLIASNTEPNIPGVDKEVEYLEQFFRFEQKAIPIRVVVIPSTKATPRNIKRAIEETDYDIIHYAGHSVFNESSPEESYLKFWSDEDCKGPVVRLKATEFDHIFIDKVPRLVFFSSCESSAAGDDKDLQDDDFLGLIDAAAQAGVPSVIGYRWSVPDNRALDLAVAFYKYLFESSEPDVALWLARSQLAASNRNDLTWLAPIMVHQV